MAQSSFDRRRINGPEESHPPRFLEPDGFESSPGQPGPRTRRNPTDIRPIFLQPTLITQANGSVYMETERTKIACAVYGPRQSKSTAYSEKGKLNVEVKYAPFSCHKRKMPIRDAEDRSLSLAIQQALVPSVRLELLPKSTVDVFITIIEADGVEGCIASGTIAASAALADAGIEMLGLVTSCSAALVGEDVWLDPNEEESSISQGTFILSYMPALQTVSNVWQSGQMQIDDVLSCMEACQDRCVDIHAVVAQALLENSKRRTSAL